ncbi:MAG: SAM-dependent methyltransferase, partial [Pseudomonas sp.]
MQAQLPPSLQQLHLPLRLKLWDGNQFDLGPSPQVTILIKEPQLISQLSHPSMGELGTAFVEGKLELEGDIGEAIRVCDELSDALLVGQQDTTPVRSAHDKHTDAQAISYHYDVSNEFYQLWLDQDMAYSCAYFKEPDNTLDQAQQDKFDHLCRKLRLQQDDYL